MLKNNQNRIKDIKEKLNALYLKREEVLRNQIKPLQRKVSKIEGVIHDLEMEKINLQRTPTISDQVIFRVLERKYGFSFDDIRNDILSDTRKEYILNGASKIKYDNMELVIKDNVIVAVI